MSKLVTNEIFDVVEKLHKAGLSDAVAIEVIRQNRDIDISKLATAEQVQNVDEKVDDLKDDFKNLEGKVNLLELEVSHIKENMVTKVEFAEVDIKLERLRAELKSEIKETGTSLMKWFIVLFTTQIASVVGVIVTLLLK